MNNQDEVTVEFGIDAADTEGTGDDPRPAADEETHGDEDVTRPVSDPEQRAAAMTPSSGINWPTVAVAAGISAVVSAVVLAIGMAGLLMANAAAGDGASAQPTVVNLGAAAPVASVAPGAPAVPAAPEGEAPETSEAAPVAPVPAEAPAVPATPDEAAPAATAAAGQPTTPTLGGFQRDLAVLRSGASNAQKGKLLEGGAPAAATLTKVLNYGKQFEAVGMGYRLVGPVKQDGTTATARLELYAPGYQPNYLTMRFLWMDGRWKLSNKSVCELASFAQIPCNVR